MTSITGATGHEQGHAVQHELSFVRKYIFATDHKVIGIQFLLTGLLMLFLGGALALIARMNLAWYDNLPMGSLLEALGLATRSGEGAETVFRMDGQVYNMLFTMHASVMIFLVIIPILTGAFGNFLIPLMIGARDMAFPRLNMYVYWLMPVGIVVLSASFFVAGGASAGGWTGYPPLATNEYSPGLGHTLWCLGVFIIGWSSILGSVNYITTIIMMRTKGMTMFRMPLTVWALFITAILALLGTPVLGAAMLMMSVDRMFGGVFFLAEAGGQPLLWQHLFWFYSHPAVYIMILPAMGFVSDILSTFARKPIFGYKPMIYSLSGIAGLGFIVWGHHMFMSGMNPLLGMTFMISTTFIALPSAIKVFNWLSTLWRGDLHMTAAMWNAVAFVSMFIIGGLTGIFMSSTPVDIHIHDTYFIVGHIHYVLFGGSMFGIFAAVHYWFPKMFGKMLGEGLGKLHFWISIIAFNVTFWPMHIIGMAGHPRRFANISSYKFMADMQDWHEIMTIGAFVLGFAQFILVFNIIKTLGSKKRCEENPWKANSLEWTTVSPAPHGNWEGEIPAVYHGPYEYSSPLVPEDWLPQTKETPGTTS